MGPAGGDDQLLTQPVIRCTPDGPAVRISVRVTRWPEAPASAALAARTSQVLTETEDPRAAISISPLSASDSRSEMRALASASSGWAAAGGSSGTSADRT